VCVCVWVCVCLWVCVCVCVCVCSCLVHTFTWCETRSVTLREVHRLWLFETMVLRNVFCLILMGEEAIAWKGASSFYLLTKYSGDRTKQDVSGEYFEYWTWWINRNERDNLKDLGTDNSIILKLVSINGMERCRPVYWGLLWEKCLLLLNTLVNFWVP